MNPDRFAVDKGDRKWAFGIQLPAVVGLIGFVNEQPDFRVVGEAGNGLDAVQIYRQQQPDVVLMDLRMPVMNGVSAIKEIKEKEPDVQILVLTTYDDDEWVFDAIRAEAHGRVYEFIRTSRPAA